MKKIERKIKKNINIPIIPFEQKAAKYGCELEEQSETLVIKKNKQSWIYVAFALLFVVITALILCGVLLRGKKTEKTYGENDIVTTACERADLTNLSIYLPDFDRYYSSNYFLGTLLDGGKPVVIHINAEYIDEENGVYTQTEWYIVLDSRYKFMNQELYDGLENKHKVNDKELHYQQDAKESGEDGTLFRFTMNHSGADYYINAVTTDKDHVLVPIEAALQK